MLETTASVPLSRRSGCNPACRACHYKDLDYAEQLVRKSAWARSQFARWQGAWHSLVPAPVTDRLGYRSKSWLRSSFAAGALSFGMIRSRQLAGRWQKEFVSWDDCPLHDPALLRVVARLRETLAQSAPDFCDRALVGVWVGSPHLVLVSRESAINSAINIVRDLDWSRILEPPFDRAWFHCNPQVGRKIFGHLPIEPIYGATEDMVHPVRVFRQVARGLLEQARSLAAEYLLVSQPRQVLDLYCGTGEFSLLLPLEVDWIGVELSGAAVEYANALQPKARRVHEAFVGTVEHRLLDPRLRARLESPLSLYLNPPRMGLGAEGLERVLELMREHAPRRIAYLSCSASSLARDLREFEGVGYRIERLQSYDFFPQTEHFETLALLSGP